MNKPLYTHDCAACRYVGRDDAQPGEPSVNGVDLYVHDNPSGKITLIRRYGSEGPNYASHSLFGLGCRQRIGSLDRWSLFEPLLTRA